MNSTTLANKKADLVMHEECLMLSGIVDKHSVPELYRKSQKLDDDKALTSVCLNAVEHIDSAGLALLLEWRAWSKKTGQPLRLLNAPQQLRMLAQLSELEETLDLEYTNADP